MAIYNGAIKVRPCEWVNIPQPGILVDFFPDATWFYDDTKFPGIFDIPDSIRDTCIEANVGGGDVIYATDTATGADYIWEIEEFIPNIHTIVPAIITIKPHNCPPLPPGGVISGADLDLKIYRGNYSPTNGTLETLTGYTGAGNSEGYSLYSQGGGGIIKLLTVNNDLIDLPVESTASIIDLQVVKVLEINAGGGPGTGPDVWALRVQ